MHMVKLATDAQMVFINRVLMRIELLSFTKFNHMHY
jgi:hypothetical protein